jgi:hypothetical protein
MEFGEIQAREPSTFSLLAKSVLIIFVQNLTLRVDRLTPSRIEFDLIGIDASIANALRRICIAEVRRVPLERNSPF